MGAGLLPISIHNNKLYFLLGKENKYEVNAPGYCDFGGGTDEGETYEETALREGSEELTGFLGSKEELKSMMKKGTYDFIFDERYKMFLLPIEYDEKLPFYYNNNQRFLQKNLDPNVIKKTKIFEKAEIKWVCVDDFLKMRHQFRKYFKQNSIIIYKDREKIYNFAKKILKKSVKTRKYRSYKNKTFKNY
jgi:hypothetical protein